MRKNGKYRSYPLSRRGFVWFGVAALLGSKQALAQVQSPPSAHFVDCTGLIPKKSSKEDARHRVNADRLKNCGSCRFFLPPDQCVLVEGATTEGSVCALWAKNDSRPIGCRP
jgi:hypothetical protein